MSRDGCPSLIQIPEYLQRNAAEALGTTLTKLWVATMGAKPGGLEADLRACKRWFDPVAQGQRLRRALSELNPVPEGIDDPGPPLTIAVGDKRLLVTPEGRCALDLLQHLPDKPVHVISEAQLVRYDRLLAVLYRDWARHRLQSVVDLLAGSTKPLQIPAAGVVIALLVNRCTTEQRALTRFASGSAKEVVDRAFFTPVQAFADILAPSRRGNRNDPRLVSGWMLYEARRRLGDGLVLHDARNGIDGKVWIQSEAADHVIEVVTRDLVRGHRARATPERFADAYDALVTALRHELPKLAGFRLVHERPLETRQLRKRLLESLDRQSRALA
jgi:hypothetical protein